MQNWQKGLLALVGFAAAAIAASLLAPAKTGTKTMQVVPVQYAEVTEPVVPLDDVHPAVEPIIDAMIEELQARFIKQGIVVLTDAELRTARSKMRPAVYAWYKTLSDHDKGLLEKEENEVPAADMQRLGESLGESLRHVFRRGIL
jgi:hypothetical protein